MHGTNLRARGRARSAAGGRDTARATRATTVRARAGNARDHRDGRGLATVGGRGRANGDAGVGNGRDAGGHRDNGVAGGAGVGSNRGVAGGSRDHVAAAGGTTARDDGDARGRDGGSRRGSAALGTSASRGGGLVGRAVGDGRAAGGDGHILGLVDSLNVAVGHGGSKAGEESDGGSSETHFDCSMWLFVTEGKPSRLYKNEVGVLKESGDSWFVKKKSG